MRRDAELVVALDHPDRGRALELVDRLGGSERLYKVGLELFVRVGPGIVEALHERGHRVFLDLKLHDIPNTVRAAARVIAGLGVEFVTVHASGGMRMVAAAHEGLAGAPTRLLAVTVLTSLSGSELALAWGRSDVDPAEEVRRLADLAVEGGAHGVVASPEEAALLRSRLGKEALIVTPGVRMAEDEAQDQVRTLDPPAAVEAGADFLVVGRPITQAEDPVRAWQRYRNAMFPEGAVEGETR